MSKETTLTPRHLGQPIAFRDHAGEGLITDEADWGVFIEHPFFTGWMEFPEFYERMGSKGIEDDAPDLADTDYGRKCSQP